MVEDQKSEVAGNVAVRREHEQIWTSDDLRTFRTELLATRDLREVAAVLDRPVEEVEEMARSRWIEAPQSAPE